VVIVPRNPRMRVAIMARPKNKIPSYLPHAPSGQARVRVNGRDVYLGPYGSSESKQAYARFIAENYGDGHAPSISIPAGEPLTVAALAVKYDDFARTYYVKNGQPTDETYMIGAAVAPLVELYGNTPVNGFSPKRLKAVRDYIVSKGNERTGGPLTRKYVNRRIDCIVRMFRWAVEEELVPVTVYQALKTVVALRKGRAEGVRESEPVNRHGHESGNAAWPRIRHAITTTTTATVVQQYGLASVLVFRSGRQGDSAIMREPRFAPCLMLKRPRWYLVIRTFPRRKSTLRRTWRNTEIL
jgi:hypothetical protein